MKRFDFHEDYAAPQPNGTTIKASLIVSKRGDRLVTLVLNGFDKDGEHFCDQEVEFSSVEAAKFARLLLSATRCAGDFENHPARLEEVA
ncbi:MAG: hypothetical protein AAF412_04135 [Pseudomonadota bacterium]